MPVLANEPANGMVWTISSPAAGTTATANYVLGTASGNTLAGLLNPLGNPKPLYLMRAVLVVVTGTMVTGGFVWGVSPASQAAAITSTGATAARNNLTFIAVTHAAVNGPIGEGFVGDTTNSVLAGSTANTVAMLRPFGGGVVGAIAAGSVYTLEEIIEGEISVAPGCFAGLFVATGATTPSPLVVAGLTWSEGS